MNIGMVLIALVLIFAASVGLVAMVSGNSEPVTDTFGNTHNEATNATHSTMVNTTAPLATVGGGIGLAVVVVFVCGTLFGILALVLHYGRKGGYGER